ncbi:hypothetical protein K439DRAFT_1625289 [Ramaria rubella]|nr:hypothetical protein K439DRAFT_1625289 [Ramaria rubella]
MPKAKSSKESKKKLAPSPISCGIHAMARAGLRSSKAKTTISVRGPMTRTPPVTPQQKRNTKGPPSDAEVISMHTELVPLLRSFGHRKVTMALFFSSFQLLEVIANFLSIKQEHVSPGLPEDHQEDSPSPQKKDRKHLNGVIPTSEEEVSEPGDVSKIQGGWSDGSSLSGFIVNDNDPVEMRTDSRDSFLDDT